MAFAAGAGYGDPSSAIPSAVREDVEVEDISREAARDIFRVVLVGDEPEVDHAATAALRRQAIVDRLGREPRPRVSPRPPVLMHVTEYLDLVAADGGRKLACARCGHALCAVGENYKAALRCASIGRSRPPIP